jgi:RHS repeat-associated protein
MIPVILGLGGLAVKVAAAAVIPHIVRAISSCIPTTTATRPPEPVSVERISMASDAPQTTAKWGVSPPRPRSRKWGYAGLFHHGPSGLDLATYRTYDSTMGRWISRDPLGEGVDYNLYRYCGNNPISMVDPMGLDSAPPGMDPIEFRKGKNRRSKVKGACARQTIEVTAMGIAGALTIVEWALFTVDIGFYFQMTRGGLPRGGLSPGGAGNPPQYYVEDGVRRSMAARETGGVSNINAVLNPGGGAAPRPITVNLGQLNVPSHRNPFTIDDRYIRALRGTIEGQAMPPIQLQPLGAPGQSGSIPLSNLQFE